MLFRYADGLGAQVTRGFLFLLLSCSTTSAQSGGCSTHTAAGYHVGVCISNMNGMALPDFYVDASAGASNCEIVVITNDASNGFLGSTTVDCTVGHKVIYPVGTFDDAITLHASATLSIAGVQTQIGSSPSVVVPGTTSLNYTYTYPIASPPYPSPQQVLKLATTNFQNLFPFPSCGNIITVGQTCDLGPGPFNPIEVVDISPTSFSFLSLPGHAEGAGRVILFSFFVDGTTNNLDFDVFAKGPWSASAQGTVSTGAAQALWQKYANNLKTAVAHLT